MDCAYVFHATDKVHQDSEIPIVISGGFIERSGLVRLAFISLN